MKKILVTGATGNVGTFVCDALLNKGEGVVAAVTDISRATGKVNANAHMVEFDFTKPQTFNAALAGIDRVFLMRPPHLGKPEDLLPFIEAMKNANIRLVCFLSLMGVENNPVPPHHKIEKYIEKAGLPFVHIRPGFFMQNLTGIHLPEIKEKDEIFIPAGRSRCSFIDSKDIGLAIAEVLFDPNKYENTTATITGPEALDYYQVAAIFSDILGRRIVYKSPSIFKFRRYMIKERLLDKPMVNIMVMLYLMTRLGTAKKVTGDFQHITGLRPRSVRVFVEENRACFEK